MCLFKISPEEQLLYIYLKNSRKDFEDNGILLPKEAMKCGLIILLFLVIY